MTADTDRNIVLTGFMATGKTTVGQTVAKLLNRPFVDADEAIIRRAGMSIPQIFERDGEAGFRALERDVCYDLAVERGKVIATGGGMLVDPENRRRMLASGIVVCLDAPKEVIGARLAASQDRPLAGDWAALLDKRRAAYAAIPLHINTEGKTPEIIAQEIITLWRNDSE
ncbi:MAG: shikimate kinase [Anaerolineae bacterium]|nr:shikimate kinase [Anaerolineae bacterium]NUQ02265.1 shikimate kinase [Anaerolineae bacterium]